MATAGAQVLIKVLTAEQARFEAVPAVKTAAAAETIKSFRREKRRLLAAAIASEKTVVKVLSSGS